jgi:hypothetical protein
MKEKRLGGTEGWRRMGPMAESAAGCLGCDGSGPAGGSAGEVDDLHWRKAGRGYLDGGSSGPAEGDDGGRS